MFLLYMCMYTVSYFALFIVIEADCLAVNPVIGGNFVGLFEISRLHSSVMPYFPDEGKTYW